MSVRTLLFSLLALVIVGLIGMQWGLTRQQHQQLAQALSTTAFTVSRDTVSVLLFEQNDESALLHDQSFEMRLDSDPQQGSIVLRGPLFEHRIDIPKTSIRKTLQDSQQRQLWLALLVSIIGVTAALMIAYRFAKPLQLLQSASAKVANGQFGTQLQSPRFAPRELQQSIAAFNQMSRALQQLEQDNQTLRARQQVDELSDLARGLAHTMRNPLNTLGLSIEQMADEQIDTEEREKLAAMARRQISAIDQRLRALLDVSALNEVDQSVQLIELIREICSEYGNRTIAIEGDLSVHVLGQPRELTMVLHTLISNAVEASDAASVININLAKENHIVTVTVCDSGQGISATIAERIFQPHVSSKPHGAGLGLYLAKRVVSGRYFGDIRFSPNLPQGTQAQLTLRDRRSK